MSAVVLAEEAKNFAPRISHYGCGLYADSPVKLILPPAITGEVTSFATDFEFALAVQEVYAEATSPSDFQKIRGGLRRMVLDHWKQGYYTRSGWNAKDLLHQWRHANLCSYHNFPQSKTAEHALLDKLGRLALLSEYQQLRTAASSFDEDWTHYERFASVKRGLIDGTALAGLVAGASATAAWASEPASAAAFGLGLFFLRFKSTYRQLKAPTLLETEAFNVYPGDNAAKRAFAKRMLAGLTPAEIFADVQQALERDYVERESARATRALAAITNEDLFHPEEGSHQESILDLYLTKDPRSIQGWELLEAQRELLREWETA